MVKWLRLFVFQFMLKDIFCIFFSFFHAEPIKFSTGFSYVPFLLFIFQFLGFFFPARLNSLVFSDTRAFHYVLLIILDHNCFVYTAKNIVPIECLCPVKQMLYFLVLVASKIYFHSNEYQKKNKKMLFLMTIKLSNFLSAFNHKNLLTLSPEHRF